MHAKDENSWQEAAKAVKAAIKLGWSTGKHTNCLSPYQRITVY
ncbi:hypothetical protein ACNKHU_27515 [Shigella flexneri]